MINAHPTLRWLLVLGLSFGSGLLQRNHAAEPNPAKELRPGHSWHGEAFNEGPRQTAYLMSGMPDVHFPITTAQELAQRFFDQGVGQLHGFWYFEAERSFRRVHQLDPRCAMAYWGMAMANVENAQRAREFLTNAVALKTNVTVREQRYIEALDSFHRLDPKREAKQRKRDLVRDYERLVRDYPDDLEAKAFLIYQIWHNSGFGNSGDWPISSHAGVDALASQVLAKAPWHPVHHFRIHLWDPENPAIALNSAARCGQGSPAIAHMWHMPGHTYSKLHRHDDAAWQQEASARVDHAQMMRDRVLPDQIHNYAHNNQWLIESWEFAGRVREGLELAKNMIELPRLMRTNAASAHNPKAPRFDFGNSSWNQGRRRLLDLLTSFELWDEIIALGSTPYLDGSDVADQQARRAWALALAWFEKGDPDKAAAAVTALNAAIDLVREERQGAVDAAESRARSEKKPSAEITKAMQNALAGFQGRMDQLESLRTEIAARAALAEGDTNAFAENLTKTLDVPKERLSQLHWKAGDPTKALALAKEAAEAGTNQFLPWAHYASLLWSSGRSNEAHQAFGVLHQMRIRPDLDLPVAERLAPVAASIGLPSDWRVEHPPRADSGSRPSLDSLGPVHWRPSLAPLWTLVDAEGRKRSFVDYRGHPVVVIFYLGRGCAHCIEQLSAFTPLSDAFAKAGMELVAISTDDVAGLGKTYRQGSERETFPFPLVSDASLDTFKAWRVFDDFENKPLHGTFLVDAAGQIRWQHMSYEPFMEPQFLLEEARRLLRFGRDRD